MRLIVRIAWLSALSETIDVAPDAVEDLAAMDRLAAALDEEDQQIEIAGDQRQLAPVADEHPAAGREDEVTETIAWHEVFL